VMLYGIPGPPSPKIWGVAYLLFGILFIYWGFVKKEVFYPMSKIPMSVFRGKVISAMLALAFIFLAILSFRG
jgi:hypothetical protein